MNRPAPRTLEEFGVPVHRHLWRLTSNGITLTWDEYEHQLLLAKMAAVMTEHDAAIRKDYLARAHRRGTRP